MIIKGKKIYLKKGFSNKEYSKLLEWFKDIEIIGYFSFVKKALIIKTIKELKSFCYQLKDALYFGIYTNKSKKFIGYTVLGDFKKKQCEMGLTIGNKNYWGKGVGYEATKITLEYAFDTVGLKKVYLTTSEYNKRAINLYKKIGFEITKKIPNDRVVYHNNKWIKSATVCMEIKK